MTLPIHITFLGGGVRRPQLAAEQLAAGAVLLEFEYDESKHPRTPAGEPGGGRWTTGAEGSPTFAHHVSVLHTTSAEAAADILAHGFNPLYGTRIGSKFGEGIYTSLPTHSGIDVQTRIAYPNSVQLKLEVGVNKVLDVDPGWEIESDAWERKMYEEAGVTKEQMVSRGREIIDEGMANWREWRGSELHGDVPDTAQMPEFSDWLLEHKGEMAATPFVDGKAQALREAVVKQGYDTIVYHDPTGASGMGDMVVAMHANQIQITEHHEVGPAPKQVTHLDPVTLLPLPEGAKPNDLSDFRNTQPRTGNESDAELRQRGYTQQQISEMKAEHAKYAVSAAATPTPTLVSLLDLMHLYDRPLQAAGVLEFDFDEAKHPRNPAGQSDGGRFTKGDGGDAAVAARVGIIQEGMQSGVKPLLTAQAMRIARALPNANVQLSENMEPKYATIVADSAEEFASKYPKAAATVGYVVSEDINPGTIAQVRSSNEGLSGFGVPYPLEKGQVGIELSRVNFSAYSGMSLEDVAHHSYEVGFHPVDGVKALIDHEFGHVLDYAAYGTVSHERIMTSSDQRAISGYAKEKGSSEAFAEAFAMRQAGLPLITDATKELDAANTQLLENRNTIRAAGVYDPGGEVTCAGYVPEALLPRLTAAAHDVTDEARDDHGRWTTGGESVSEHVKTEGGMTYDPATGTEPVDGYIVAKAGIPSTSIDTDTFLSDEVAAKDALKAFLVEHAAEFDDPDAMIGIWHDTDPDHDEIVLDVVERMDTEEEGVQAGIERNQQAIWDVVGKREIPTGGTGQITASVALELGDSEGHPFRGNQWTKYGPSTTRNGPAAMSMDEAVAAGYTLGPYYHSTDHKAEILRDGFHQEGAEAWEIPDHGNIEEYKRFGHANPIFVGTSPDEVQGYGSQLVRAMVKEGGIKDSSGMTLAGGYFIPDARNVVPLKDG